MRLSPEQLQHWAKKGFLILPQVASSEILSSLVTESMRAWTQTKGVFEEGASWLQNALLPNVHHHSAAVCRYYFTGPLVDVATQLIGPNVKAATSQLTFKLRGNTQTFGWHQDNGYGELSPANAISTLTAFDDTDENNGCLWVMPGSHNDGQIDVSNVYSAADKEAGHPLNIPVTNMSDAVPVKLRAGDAVILHCHLLHRSEGNHSADRDRRILFLRYADADAVEVYNNNAPRLGTLLRGSTKFEQVREFERELWPDQPYQT